MVVVLVVSPPAVAVATPLYTAEKHLDLMSISVHLLRAEDDSEDNDGGDDPPGPTHRNANLVHPYVVIVIAIVVVIVVVVVIVIVVFFEK